MTEGGEGDDIEDGQLRRLPHGRGSSLVVRVVRSRGSMVTLEVHAGPPGTLGTRWMWSRDVVLQATRALPKGGG